MADRPQAAPLSLEVTDRAARAAALDCARSVIVQAPAGSGKTELLAQRVLALLATVDAPEEIVAITFTRKAAAEMRDRILAALARADGPPPAEAHEAETWRLARAALARDDAREWNLLGHPSRLAIGTFDALCSALARRLPVTSRLGALPSIAEDPQPLYVEAARMTLAAASTDDSLARPWTAVLRHLDNDVTAAVDLVGRMLGRREQWLPLVIASGGHADWRAALEAALRAEIERVLAAARETLPPGDADELLQLARFAAEHHPDRGFGDSLRAAAAGRVLPAASPAAAPAWRALAELLLTASTGELRRKVDRRCGFPGKDNAATKAIAAEYAARKQAMEALLARLAAHSRAAAALERVRSLPPAVYADEQWEVVAALLVILRRAAAELDVLFAERGLSDFTGVAMAAQRALGTPDAPTDLLQGLDTRIRHLLVDEFQDTSRAQFGLLATLTAGWEPTDGRTLFVVGDPMQSIYRFRQAEVALFGQAQAEGIGPVSLSVLRLALNFRSVPEVVHWVNVTFAPLFARAEGSTADRVEYAEATAAGSGEGEVGFHLAASPQAEAQKVVELVRAARAQDPDGTVAILVRSRAHLAEVVPALRVAGFAFQAVEIDALRERQVIIDLTALARALRRPADRHAWLALLHGPLVGLTLPEVLAVAGDAGRTIREQIADAQTVAALAPEAQARLRRFAMVTDEAIAARGQQSFARRVEAAWLACGGAVVVDSETDLVAAQQFFAELRAFESREGMADWPAFERRLDALYAPPDPAADERLQLLTIHRAKGLQFDTVIVPGTTRLPARGDPTLMRWRTGPSQPLLLAPINPRDDAREPIHAHLKALERAEDEAELARLLYVAATRAVRALHWVGHATTQQLAKRGGYAPPGGSLLGRLWPVARGQVALPDVQPVARPPVAGAGSQSGESADGALQGRDSRLRRLPATWSPVPMPADITIGTLSAAADRDARPPFDWAREVVRHVGSVAHRYLLQVARDGLDRWDDARIEAARPAIAAALRESGVAGADLEPATGRVVEALARTLVDPRGRWIFAAGASDGRSEYGISRYVGGEVVRIVVDRTFVAADGTRWVVDFKTGVHEGVDRETFLDSEAARYRPQLERYATALRDLDPRPIRVALYFPLLGAWREWDPFATAPVV